MRVAFAGLMFLLPFLGGCYSTRSVRVDSIRQPSEDVTYVIRQRDGSEFRARIGPLERVDDEIVECRPCAYDADSWRIRFAGWPAVYRAGKYWRREVRGDVIALDRADIRSARVEEFSWPLTIVTSPLSLPVGVIDFLVDNAQVGFDAVNNRYDDFSNSPEHARR